MDSDYGRLNAIPAEETHGSRARVAALFEGLRPYQWPKNAIVFAALLFSAGDSWKAGDPSSWWPLLWRSAGLFAAWCLVSSAVYLVNDIRDREFDRIHPRKRSRPIASGRLAPQVAGIAAALLAAVGVGAAFALSSLTGVILVAYVGLMVAYSLGLKRVAILDVLILSGGLVARAVSGAVAIDVKISPWLYVCTSFAAFFFATSKRWAEARDLGEEAPRHRPALEGYGDELLGQMVTISAATALLSYALYTIESVNVPPGGAMALTIPFVGFALFRYLLLLGGRRRKDAPDRILFTDPQILIAAAGFVGTVIGVLLYNH